MGNAQVTAQNLKVVKVDAEENLLLVRGSVPGPNGTCLMIRKAKKFRKPVVRVEPKAKAKK